MHSEFLLNAHHHTERKNYAQHYAITTILQRKSVLGIQHYTFYTLSAINRFCVFLL